MEQLFPSLVRRGERYSLQGHKGRASLTALIDKARRLDGALELSGQSAERHDFDTRHDLERILYSESHLTAYTRRFLSAFYFDEQFHLLATWILPSPTELGNR
jgi:hypothetical protein